jgi:hypothetical protein
MPNTTSAIGCARVRISLLSISPASPPLMMLSFTPACDSNCASSGLGSENEPCTSTRSSCADGRQRGAAARRGAQQHRCPQRKNPSMHRVHPFNVPAAGHMKKRIAASATDPSHHAPYAGMTQIR